MGKLAINKIISVEFLKNIKNILYFWYIYKKEIFSLNKELIFEKHSLGLITICFNNADILKLQYKHIKENILDDYIYIIADNSNNEIESDNVALFAKENNLVYIKLPPNPYSNINASKSHGLAINFIYKKIISDNNLKYLGFIDQDIFPIVKVSIIKKIENLPYYGLIQNRKKGSYLWPGFCFFNKEFLLKVKKINFMPIRGLDTGGGNYKIFDKNIISKISIEHYYIKNKTGEKIEKSYPGIQNDCVEFIDGWIHLMNSSNWINNYQKIK